MCRGHGLAQGVRHPYLGAGIGRPEVAAISSGASPRRHIVTMPDAPERP